MADELARAKRLVAQAKRIVALTGAGISTESGIPDFRGPNGVWTKNPAAERLATLQNYLSDASVRRESWRQRPESPMFQARPNAGHQAFVELEKQGRLHLLVTQNVDGLHLIAGNSRARVVEIHGTVHEVMCMGCDRRTPMKDAIARVRAGEDDLTCLDCGGILKSATVSFGQGLFPGDMERAERAAGEADLMLAVGTSLGVYPAAGIVPAAVQAGARLIIVNAQPTPFDRMADVVLRQPIGDVLPQLADA